MTGSRSRHIISALLLLILFLPTAGYAGSKSGLANVIDSLYAGLGLGGVLDREPFRLAVIGYINLLDGNSIKKDTPLTIIDYTKPSTEKRMVIIDIPGRSVLRTSLVAHGKNTGENYARSFSDEPNSLMSSFGFFATGETYYGKHEYSLKLYGLEEEFNGNAIERYIVIHGAWYVSEEFIRKYGRLGRSWGCPALPLDSTTDLINLVKGGSCLFIYAGDKDYPEKSALIDEERADTWFFENGNSLKTDSP